MSEINCIKEGAIATVNIAGPNARNAISLAMWKRMATIFRELGSDRNIRAIILTGSDSAFSAGADFKELETLGFEAQLAETCEQEAEACAETIANIPQPVIAAVSGICLGGGCQLSLACDFRFADLSACFGIPAADFSIVYGVRGTKRLLSLVGLVNAKRMLYTAERVNAQEALNIGLVDRLCSDALEDARDLARQIASKAPLSISGAKYILNDAALADGGLLARAMIRRAAESKDFLEAVKSFKEKRQPRFQGF